MGKDRQTSVLLDQVLLNTHSNTAGCGPPAADCGSDTPMSGLLASWWAQGASSFCLLLFVTLPGRCWWDWERKRVGSQQDLV